MFPKPTSLPARIWQFQPEAQAASGILIQPPLAPMNAYKQSLYVAMIRIMANLIMLAAIFIAMYQASRWPGWPSEAVFCLIFFGITIPVWVCTYFIIRHIRRRWPTLAQTLMRLPGCAEDQLVTWKVLERHKPGRYWNLRNIQ